MPLKLTLVRIQPRRRAQSPAQALWDDYLARCRRYSPTESRDFATEADFLAALDKAAGRTAPALILADSTGLQLTSPEFAKKLGRLAEGGTQEAFLAIGPADGWSGAARSRATFTVAFGKITLPHELAAVVLAEQTYRALTILAGHPYHSGHE